MWGILIFWYGTAWVAQRQFKIPKGLWRNLPYPYFVKIPKLQLLRPCTKADRYRELRLRKSIIWADGCVLVLFFSRQLLFVVQQNRDKYINRAFWRLNSFFLRNYIYAEWYKHNTGASSKKYLILLYMLFTRLAANGKTLLLPKRFVFFQSVSFSARGLTPAHANYIVAVGIARHWFGITMLFVRVHSGLWQQSAIYL